MDNTDDDLFADLGFGDLSNFREANVPHHIQANAADPSQNVNDKLEAEGMGDGTVQFSDNWKKWTLGSNRRGQYQALVNWSETPGEKQHHALAALADLKPRTEFLKIALTTKKKKKDRSDPENKELARWVRQLGLAYKNIRDGKGHRSTGAQMDFAAARYHWEEEEKEREREKKAAAEALLDFSAEAGEAAAAEGVRIYEDAINAANPPQPLPMPAHMQPQQVAAGVVVGVHLLRGMGRQ